ncbi:MAG: hypothetical protein KC776_33390 [Myxococcales bacterium]|nr:hypothetical protein [Myxococcales bacterium]MCB9582041.1 SAM-dependent methyltransferase [Polyangiaceae bacterium]
MKSRQRFTFQGNLRETRHGWLRLTPAYSVHVVRELLAARARPDLPVLDPFCGTGTTLLSCAESGVDCDTVDVNPFLVWLARAKTARYSERSVAAAEGLGARMAAAARAGAASGWTPEIHRIERWWDDGSLSGLAAAFAVLAGTRAGKSRDLAALGFCRTLIAASRASFGHQSMSFADAGPTRSKAAARRAVAADLAAEMPSIAAAARAPLPRATSRVVLGDARDLKALGPRVKYGTVITSPPYANRMSYIRELRPYMYWLGYLKDRRAAGDLDWTAIGGTWGAATSRLSSWKPPKKSPAPGLLPLVKRISKQSAVLGSYVLKYFTDMDVHVRSLRPRVAAGGEVHYIVGNSKFFDVVLPVEELLAAQLEAAGFRHAEIHRLRKRTSKRELYEFRVSARSR